MKLPIALWIGLKNNFFWLFLKMISIKKMDLSVHLMDQCLSFESPVTVTILLTCKKYIRKYDAK